MADKVVQGEIEWAIAKPAEEAIAAQEVKDGRVVNGRAWLGMCSTPTVKATKELAVAAFARRYGHEPRVVHYQESCDLWWVGPLGEGER